MTKNSAASAASLAATILLLWLAIGPVLAATLSFVGALPTQFPAVAHFASSPIEWRLAFFLAGVLAIASAWLVRKGMYRAALAPSLVFAGLYLAGFPIVWGQRNFGMALAVVAALLVGGLALVGRRVEV